MDFRDFYATTYQYHHNLESVTLTRPESISAGPEETVTVEHVRCEPVSDADVDNPLGGMLDGSRRTFHFWAAECGGLTPGQDWLVTMIDGTVWRILSVETLAHGARYRAKTIQKQG